MGLNYRGRCSTVSRPDSRMGAIVSHVTYFGRLRAISQVRFGHGP